MGRYTNAETLYPADGTKCGNLGENFAYDQVSYVDYAEGIYVGYRWYETADAQHFWDGVENRYGQGYDGVVQYPFGYGLSYTEFQWELLEAPKEQTVPDPFGEISVMVRVTNTGKRAGQDVIQLYVSPPYTPGGIEKSSVAWQPMQKHRSLSREPVKLLRLPFLFLPLLPMMKRMQIKTDFRVMNWRQAYMSCLCARMPTIRQPWIKIPSVCMYRLERFMIQTGSQVLLFSINLRGNRLRTVFP